MRANIRQVAEKAGVSRTTVSNVLLGRQDVVSPDTFESVMQAVRELDYVPVRSTLQNRHVETRVIALPMDDPTRLKWSFHNGNYRGICEGALKHHYDVLTLLRPDPDWAVERRELQFLDRRSDGIIFVLPDIGETQNTYETLAQHRIPTVVCYRRDVPAGIAWVDPDNKGAMFGAVAHLVKQGHTRIAHLTKAKKTRFDAVERCRYFAQAMHHFGLADCAEWIVNVPYFAVSVEPAQQIMSMGATAIVCMNDLLALNLWEAMESNGLRVPEDLSLVGVDNGPDAELRGLTTMGFSFAEIGRRAVDSLVACIQGQSPEECSHVVPVQLYDRRSVASR